VARGQKWGAGERGMDGELLGLGFGGSGRKMGRW
jgi:hypothetical protein